jgi:hypothetical protein
MAENLILRNEYLEAMQQVNRIEGLALSQSQNPHTVPPLMWQLTEQKWASAGRIHRARGEFLDARNAFEVCYKFRRLRSPNKIYHIVRQLADMYIELYGHLLAKELLDKWLDQLYRCDREQTGQYQRLSLSYVALEIRMENFSFARSRLDKIRQWFTRHPPVNQTYQLDHVRTEIPAISIAMNDKAWQIVVDCATTALSLAEQYTCFTENNYYKGWVRDARATRYCCLANADLQG